MNIYNRTKITESRNTLFTPYVRPILFGNTMKYVWGYYLARIYARLFPVPKWIEWMIAWHFWMKLAKPDPMSNEMNKTRECLLTLQVWALINSTEGSPCRKQGFNRSAGSWAPTPFYMSLSSSIAVGATQMTSVVILAANRKIPGRP